MVGSLSAGTCNVAHGANVTINGNLTVADGAVFNALFDPANAVHVTGNVLVGEGALLGLGYGTTAVVDGNINANQPLSLYLGNMTVHGNVISNGGGTAARFYNFPIKDNTIGGNLLINGWSGGWIGALRNTVGGSLDFSKNVSVVHPVNDAECMARHVPEWVRGRAGRRSGLQRARRERRLRQPELPQQLPRRAVRRQRRRPKHSLR